jgi:alpha-tubulin suppressor-like RCC1 family protein
VDWNTQLSTYALAITSTVSQLSLVAASGVTIDQCSLLTVNSETAAAESTPVIGDTTVTLSSTGSTQFYSDSNCTATITSKIIAAGTAIVSAYFKNTVAESVTITGSATGLTSGTKNTTFNSHYLAWGGATSSNTATCTAITVYSHNPNGTAYSVPSTLTVNLAGSGAGFFYSGSGCTGGQKITSTTIAASGNQKTIYIKSSTSAALVLVASATGYTDGSQAYTMGTPPAAGPTVLTLVGTNPVPQNYCQSFTVTTKNNLGVAANVTSDLVVTLTELGNGNFYADAICTTTTGTVTVANGTSVAVVYFKDDFYREGLYQDRIILTASAAGFTSGIFDGLVGAGVASRLVWNDELGISSDTCVKVTIEVRDAQDNPAVNSMVSATTINLSAAIRGTPAGTFYTDSLCTSSTTSVPVPVAETQAIAYFKTSTNDLYTLSAAAAGGLTTGVWATDVVKPIDALAISVDSRNACVITAGEVYCGGLNSNYYTLGVGDKLEHPGFNKVIGVTNAVEVVGGEQSFCARIQDGTIKCWGYSTFGQLGYGTTAISAVPVAVSGISAATKLAGSANEYCVVEAGSAKCWGRNQYGQLGNGNTTNQSSPVLVSGLTSGVTDIAVGNHNSCAVVDGGVKCWGLNYFGQLGDGTTTASNIPVWHTSLPAGTGVAKIRLRAISSYTLPGNQEVPTICVILTSNGELKCWGRNSSGNLGNGTSTVTNVPMTFLGMEAGAVDVDPSNTNTCALNQNGEVLCSGSYNYGEIGSIPVVSGNSYTATAVYKIKDSLVQMASGWSGSTFVGNAHCAILSSRRVKCWGASRDWLNELNNSLLTPSKLQNQPASPIAKLAAGSNHACTLLTNGNVECWGSNYYGQVGNNSLVDVDTSIQVATGAVDITANFSNTCVANGDGTAACWGSQNSGQVGNGLVGSGTYAKVPTPVLNLTSVTQISLGGTSEADAFACAVNANQAWCWGDNYQGQLGDGTTTDNSVPVQVAGLPVGNVTQVKAGDDFACALVNSQAWCWGYNFQGQLGVGTTYIKSTVPVAVVGLPQPVLKLSTFAEGACAVLTDNSLWCWGKNNYGYTFPNLASNNYPTPNKVFAGKVVDIFINRLDPGFPSFCALMVDNSRLCWGANPNGLLGISTMVGMESGTPKVTYTYQIVPTSGVGSMAFGSGYALLEVGGVLYGTGRNVYTIQNARTKTADVFNYAPGFITPIR